jgi:hypothetical protein
MISALTLRLIAEANKTAEAIESALDGGQIQHPLRMKW